ncbi:MAG: beta-lactamase family protein [Spirochaetales bacterium]|nr:beta-lactamase family protein [Spirochaetales bacterium]
MKESFLPFRWLIGPGTVVLAAVSLHFQGCQTTGGQALPAAGAVAPLASHPIVDRYRAGNGGQSFAGWLTDIRNTLSPVPDQSDVQELQARDRSLRGFLASEGPAVGLNQYAVAIYKDSTQIFLSNEGMNPDTVAHLASVSKIFTSVAILQLMEERKLTLKDNVATHLPDFALALKPRDGRPITIADLMRHSSGIPYHGDGRYLLTMPVRKNSYRIAAQSRPAGQEGVYSNQNTYILGAIIESVTGQSFPEYVTARILRPVGMEKTYVSPSANAASGIYSNLKEMHLFFRALMHPERRLVPLISRSSLEKMTEVPEFAGNVQKTGGFWGLGVRVSYHEGSHQEIYHNGRWTQAGGRLGYFPDEDIYLVYLGRPQNFRAEDYQKFHHSIGYMASRYVRALNRLLREKETQLATLPDTES